MIKQMLFAFISTAIIFVACSSQKAESKDSATHSSSSFSADSTIESKYLNKVMRFKIILPSTYNSLDSLPLIYLLHGYGGNENSYHNYLLGLQKLADSLAILVVCVNGETSWYVNSIERDSLRYEDYLVKELIPFVDEHYKVGKTNKQHGIAGLSMGGFGSLFLAFKHPTLFSYVGGSSACVDLKPYPENWGIKKIFGDVLLNEKVYEQHSPYYMVDSISKESLKFKLVLDCGTEDFFFQDNQRFDKKLNDLGIKHDYFTTQGDHNWAYWRVSIPNHVKRFAKEVK